MKKNWLASVTFAVLVDPAGAQGVIQPADPAQQVLQLRLQEAQQRNLLLRQQLESLREAMQARQQVVPPLGSAPLVTPGPGAVREQYRQRIIDEFLGLQVPKSAVPFKAFAPPAAATTVPEQPATRLPPVPPPASFAVPIPVPGRDTADLEVLPIAPDGTSVPGAAPGFVPPPRIEVTLPVPTSTTPPGTAQ